LSTSTLTAPLLALTALTGQALGTFRIEGQPDGRRQVAELMVSPGSPLRGRTIAEATGPVGALPVAHFAEGQPKRLLLDVDPQARLVVGDRLVVCGEPKVLGLLAQGGEDAAPHVHFASWLRRHARAAWRTLVEVDLAVKICLAVFVSIVLLSTT